MNADAPNLIHKITRRLEANEGGENCGLAHGEAMAVARILVEDVLHRNYTKVLAGVSKPLEECEEKQLDDCVERIKGGEPVQYVVGSSLFCGIRIDVSASVLIPRPETEELAEIVIEQVEAKKAKGQEQSGKGLNWKDEVRNSENLTLNCDSKVLNRDGKVQNRDSKAQDWDGKEPNKREQLPNPHKRLRVMDACTGSGCLAIAIKKALPESEVCACDISESALALAQHNAQKNDCEIEFLKADLLRGDLPDGEYDIIVSNPPYVMEKEKAEMAKTVLDYEPALALFVKDDDPLVFYKSLAQWSKRALKENGLLACEINAKLPVETADCFLDCGFRALTTRKDLFGKPRFLICQK